MADGVAITAGTGTTVATDECATGHYQRVKMACGVADSEVMIGHLEDDAHSSGQAGIMALVVRKDTAASTAGTDGDYCALVSDSTGRLHVNVGNTVTVGSHAVTNAGTFVVQIDGTALTRLTDIETNTDSGAVVGNGAAATAQRVTLANDSTGIIATVGAVTSITNTVTVAGTGTFAVQATCTNAGTFAVQVDGAALTALQLIDNLVLAEDAAHQSADPGVQFLTVRKDTAAAVSGTDGDYQPAITDANGRMHVIEPSAATIATNTGNAATSLGVMDDWDNAASDGASVSGDVAHDAADAGEPVKIGAKAETAPSGNTPVSDGDRTDVYADSDGILLTKPAASGADSLSEAVSNTDGASTAFSNFAAVANVKNAVTSITAFRTDSGTTLIYIDFRDGTAGSVIYRVPLPAGGGVTINAGGFPLFKTSANTALAFDVSAATTTVYISLSGFKTRV